MANKKKYTREEKIRYYTELIEQDHAKMFYLKYKIRRNEKRLAYLQSDSYQDWDEELPKQLLKKRAKRA